MLNWLTRYASVLSELILDPEGHARESILDVGCGPHGLACAAPNAEFAGIDVTFPHHVAPTMTAFRSPPGPLPFDDSAFDTVICLDVIEHIPRNDRHAFVVELSRVASRRVIVACPSEQSAWSQDILRVEYAARGLPLPGWLNEHDEHGLPAVAEIREICAAVPGCSARELAMANGLLAMLIVLGDMLPEFAPRANAEFREHAPEWLEVFTTARFGSSNRHGYVIEHDSPEQAKVAADRIEESVWGSVRCAQCGSHGLVSTSTGAVCPDCDRGYRRDLFGALDLS